MGQLRGQLRGQGVGWALAALVFFVKMGRFVRGGRVSWASLVQLQLRHLVLAVLGHEAG